MKFICERNTLFKEISMAQEIIASKNVISILSNIYLEAENDSLTIRATDMKVNFETKVPVTVVEPGMATVFGEKFLGILSSIPEDKIEFEQKDNKVKIKTSIKKANFQLKSMASEKFPEFPVSSKEYFEIPVKDFKEMINQTVFAVSDDETRFFMNGVYLEKTENKIVMVATDGRRLAYIEKEAEKIKDFSSVIIHPKILNVVTKRAGDEGLIDVSVTDRIIFIRFGSYNFSSLLLEGQFPNYRKVIPEEQTYTLSVDRTEMLDALRRVSLLVEQKSHRVYMGLKPGVMEIYSEEGEIGDAKEEIPCKYDGDEISLALNYRYIEEPFKVINSSEICLRFTSSNKAMTIVPVPETDFFHIVMPMQSS
ncbi:MAG: DNA polymerase III subunit beta [Treponema sp.]|jgi:DNA polymerase-3 subunit beta|nr:DNA polymerase III subunit beta [Treponema sp.]